MLLCFGLCYCTLGPKVLGALGYLTRGVAHGGPGSAALQADLNREQVLTGDQGGTTGEYNSRQREQQRE